MRDNYISRRKYVRRMLLVKTQPCLRSAFLPQALLVYRLFSFFIAPITTPIMRNYICERSKGV